MPLFVAGLGAALPLPGTGALAVVSAALRIYALATNGLFTAEGVVGV